MPRRKANKLKVSFWIIRDSINGQVWTDEGWQEVGEGKSIRIFGSEEEADAAIVDEANTLGAEPVEWEGEIEEGRGRS